MKQRIKVAGKTLIVYTIADEVFQERLKEYRIENTGDSDFVLASQKVSSIEPPNGQVLFYNSSYAYERGKYGEIYRCYGKDRLHCLITDSADGRSVNIRMTEDCAKKTGMTEAQWEYVCQQNAFARLFTEHGGLVLHGSGISFRGNGILFSADSGVGKSTHTSLWRTYYPEDTILLNDDKPAFTFEAGEIRMHGTPWSGKTALNTNQHAPLKAIVMLERGNKNEITRIGRAEAFAALIPQICTPHYHTERMETAIVRLQELLRKVPVYRLHCTMDKEAVDVVYNGLFKGEI